jgi:hypothetical protein
MPLSPPLLFVSTIFSKGKKLEKTIIKQKTADL